MRKEKLLSKGSILLLVSLSEMIEHYPRTIKSITQRCLFVGFSAIYGTNILNIYPCFKNQTKPAGSTYSTGKRLAFWLVQFYLNCGWFNSLVFFFTFLIHFLFLPYLLAIHVNKLKSVLPVQSLTWFIKYFSTQFVGSTMFRCIAYITLTLLPPMSQFRLDNK